MQCPRCRAENREGRRFCGECGLSFASTCAACGFQNEGNEKFCGGCGAPIAGSRSAPDTRLPSPESYTPKHLAEKILTSKSALEGERKQVTVLFADLKGSMELLADRDPEEARKILDPVLAHMMEAVHRYEGTVNQVMGDGIMALFGAPLAHEDHAVRACYAALRMQETVTRYAEEARRAHGVNVQIRVGLNSGKVVVRAIGSDLHMDYTAVGQTTHLAARMEQLASPGSILLTPATLELVEGFVAVKPLGPVPVKGLADPVEVYEVTGAGPARTRLQAAARRGLTRFVGRDAELEQLRHARQLAGGGHGQVAAIVAEAGVGKSRLVYEFTHSHRLQGWLVLEGASVSYGKATSYLPVIDLLKGYFMIQDRDDLNEIREKVTGKLLTLDESLKPTLPVLLALLDAPVDDAAWQALDPGQRRQRTLDAVKRLLLREARKQPLLVIFEDLHWIDGETQALLDGLVESLGSARLLLLVNYRPEYQHGWGAKTYYGQMRLDALPAESAGELLDALIGDDPGLEPLKLLLVKRGNPFFLEETIRTLVETQALAGERGRYRLTQPVPSIHVPPTVQVMLAARIDRLPPEDKRLLQVASVVGKDVSFALLQAIVDLPDEVLRGGLAHLQAAEFLYETGLFPDLEYAFTHALTHEVAYGGLLQERRRELHARIVGAIEATYEDRLAEHIERLADHAVRGQNWEKAASYLYQAGQKALARSAGHEAVNYLEAALAAIEQLPPEPDLLRIAIDVRLLLRQALRFSGDLERTERYLREAATLAEQIDDTVRRARSVVGLANLRWNQGDLRAATDYALEARGLGQAADEPSIEAHASVVLTFSWHCRGDYVRAEASGHEVLGLAPRVRRGSYYGHLVPPAVAARAYLAMTHAERGGFEAAIADGEAALRLAEELSQPFTMGIAVWGLGYVHRLRGNLDHARALLQRGLDIAKEWKINWWLAYLAWLLGHVEALSARPEGLPRLREALGHFEARGFGAHRSLVIVNFGEAYLESGDVRAAQDAGRNALMRARQLGERGYEAWALRLLGDCASLEGDVSESDVFYQDAQALAIELGMSPLAAHCHLGLGKLYRRTDKRGHAQEHLTTATAMYREMDMRFWLEQAEAEMGESTA